MENNIPVLRFQGTDMNSALQRASVKAERSTRASACVKLVDYSTATGLYSNVVACSLGDVREVEVAGTNTNHIYCEAVAYVLRRA